MDWVSVRQVETLFLSRNLFSDQRLLSFSFTPLFISNNSINVLAIDSSGHQKIESFVRSKTYQVLIIGYEKLRTCIQVLKGVQPQVGLIVCDEGHRLKSKDAKTTKMFDELTTPRRIILSGTPIQVGRVENPFVLN